MEVSLGQDLGGAFERYFADCHLQASCRTAAVQLLHRWLRMLSLSLDDLHRMWLANLYPLPDASGVLARLIFQD